MKSSLGSISTPQERNKTAGKIKSGVKSFSKAAMEREKKACSKIKV